ncbi:hypothetical protein PanWU01x14_293590 [Parasponia andersonii]|uniref:Uncharacterized protein n=1 Tax=Parasponia andersonii TaxID=3476 RepID=A0A2P5AWM0_PARAD|nr:hypothetical protein PanWU01x14_293590 [Parasponia andersonii]
MQGGAAATMATVWPSQLPAKLPHAAYCPHYWSLVADELDITGKRHFWPLEVSISDDDSGRLRSRS